MCFIQSQVVRVVLQCKLMYVRILTYALVFFPTAAPPVPAGHLEFAPPVPRPPGVRPSSWEFCASGEGLGRCGGYFSFKNKSKRNCGWSWLPLGVRPSKAKNGVAAKCYESRSHIMSHNSIAHADMASWQSWQCIRALEA